MIRMPSLVALLAVGMVIFLIQRRSNCFGSDDFVTSDVVILVMNEVDLVERSRILRFPTNELIELVLYQIMYPTRKSPPQSR